MKTKRKNTCPRAKRRNGSVFLIVVFAVALFATITMGILQMATEEIQLMRNHVYAARALATAEAGLNDAFAQIRADSSCISSFPFTSSFNGGSYTVSCEGPLPDPNITSQGTTAEGFVARMQSDITVGAASPYVIRIDNLRINE